MSDYLTTDTELQSIANAIRTKSGVSGSLVYPTGFISAIESISTGETVVSNSEDVRFIDYDGTVVYTYSASEFANLSAFPANPTHTGLTAQGWNWPLTEAKAYVAEYGELDIGQVYITDDGKTRIYIHLEEGRVSPILGICPNGTVDVDWGDGTTHDTLTGNSITTVKRTSNHTYAAAGDYVIKLTVTGSMGFYGTSSNSPGLLSYSSSSSDNRNVYYKNCIQKIEIGENITTISSSAFNDYQGLKYITICNEVTNFGTSIFRDCHSLINAIIPINITDIPNYIFNECYALESVILPYGITTIGNSVFYNCFKISKIIIPNSVINIGSTTFRYCKNIFKCILPNSITSIGTNLFLGCDKLSVVKLSNNITSIPNDCFNSCQNLENITFPYGIISIGDNAFKTCSNLTNIIFPNSITTIGSSAFDSCDNLINITLPNSITTIGTSAFSSCHNLAHIILSDEITNIPSTLFQYCYYLIDVNIPNKATIINNNAFDSCSNLTKITIPESVTNIKNNAFLSCYGLSEIHLKSTTPPTLANKSAFGIPSDCIFYVPAGCLEAYQTATNWSNFANKMQEEPS